MVEDTSSVRARKDELAATRRLVLAHGWNATCYQILNPGIRRWFAPDARGVVGYVAAHGYRVVAGSPVCDRGDLQAVIGAFEADTESVGLRTCYFAADDRLAEQLAARGPFDRLLLGAQPIWDPLQWPHILASKASLRAQLNRARNKGVAVDRWNADRAHGHPELHRCLDQWLDARGLPPLHFLVEPETLERLYDRRIFVATRDGAVIAFLVASPIPCREGWLVEQTVRGDGAPNGTSELLLDAAMRSVAVEKAQYLTLGLSPLSERSGIVQTRQARWLRLLLRWMRAHGRRFYDFEGLDAYKAKFLPAAWEPIWVITGGRRASLRMLYAIAGAFGQTSPILLGARAVARAVLREVRWLAPP